MQVTRQRILDHLNHYPTASAVELSQLFEMTSANIRHHLSVLVDQGHIEVVGEDEPNGKGRPTLRYMAAQHHQTNGLQMLTQVLIDEVRQLRTQRQRQNRLSEIGQRLSNSESSTKGSITIRLGQAMQRLNQLGYNAHWEAHADGPQVILARCPYAALVDEMPELCQMDRLMLQQLLGENAELQERFVRKPHGPHHCKFLVEK